MSNVRSKSHILFLLQPPDRFCSWLLESPSDLCCILARCSHAKNKPINTNRADGVRDQILIQDNHSPGAFMGGVCVCVCVCMWKHIPLMDFQLIQTLDSSEATQRTNHSSQVAWGLSCTFVCNQDGVDQREHCCLSVNLLPAILVFSTSIN